jgi:hypothetical protein
MWARAIDGHLMVIGPIATAAQATEKTTCIFGLQNDGLMTVEQYIDSLQGLVALGLRQGFQGFQADAVIYLKATTFDSAQRT